MANPRQRRKSRSASHTPVSHSRRAKRLLKRQPAVRGPKILQDAWNKKKTVRQNYAALGLAASLAPKASGGIEYMDNPMEPDPEPIACQNAGVSGVGALTGPPACAVPKGFGRVTRDAEGNIVSVEMNEEENAVESAKEPALVENRAAGITPEGSRWVIGGYPNSSAGRRSNVLEALEASTVSKPVPRFSSKNEVVYLERLIARYGQDVSAMSRDRKLNPVQRTSGELSRAIRKAGGFSELGLR